MRLIILTLILSTGNMTACSVMPAYVNDRGSQYFIHASYVVELSAARTLFATNCER